jgi:hypothetical protein
MQIVASRLFVASLRHQRLAKASLLFASAAYFQSYKLTTRAEPSKKPSDNEKTSETFDLAKEWEKASKDGTDFLKKMVLTSDSQATKVEEKKEEEPERSDMTFEELIKSTLLGRPALEKPKGVKAESQSNDFYTMAKTFAKLSIGDSETQEKMVQELVVRARESTGKGDFSESQGFSDVLSILTTDMKAVTNSLDKSFGQLDLSGLSQAGLFYYLEVEDERKNPSWKRRSHRFHKGLDINRVSHLNDMLYLSSLSYADTVEEIAEGCKHAFEPLELVYCDTDSSPNKPGHFIALKKNQSVWSTELEVMIVVRGTKTMTDVMTDCVVDAVPYRGGKAHNGILQSGKWIVSEHKELLEKLRKLTGKRNIKLILVGHSLGAGAASIAGIEFNDMDNYSVEVVGFGCPALLSPELARKYERCITTVVADSDIVPRMSAATVANLLIDVMEYDWTPFARRDIAHALGEVRTAYPYLLSESGTDALMEVVNTVLETYAKPSINKPTTKRVPPELCPPGTCVHLYRDGSGIAGSIAPGTFFQEIDLTRRMVNDHLISSGYEFYLLGLMRQYTKDHNFRFDHETRRLVSVDSDEHFE